MVLSGPLVTENEILPKSATGLSADAVPTALPKVIAAANAPTPRAAVVRDKRLGLSSPFTDVHPFVVTASLHGTPSSQEIATTIEEDNGHSRHGGAVRHEVLRRSQQSETIVFSWPGTTLDPLNLGPPTCLTPSTGHTLTNIFFIILGRT